MTDIKSLGIAFSLSLLIAQSSFAADNDGSPPPPSPVPQDKPVPMSAPVTKSNQAPIWTPPVSRSSGNPYQSAGTNSTTLQTGTGSTTLQTGTGSTTLQMGTDSSTLQVGVEKKAQPLNILFIVDGSRSMLEGLGPGTQKMDAAKQVLQNAIARIPSDVNLGLRVFGQSSMPSGGGGGLFSAGFNAATECQNTALWVPIGRGNRRSIIEKVRQIKPFGMTPLALAIEQAASQDFRGLEGQKVIILITDGAESCLRDPCAVIRELPRYGIQIKVDVVGLSLRREPEAKRQLNCIADSSGGKYYDANTAADLIESVSQSVSKAIEGRVIIKPSAGSNSAKPINTETGPELVPIEPSLQVDPTLQVDPLAK